MIYKKNVKKTVRKQASKTFSKAKRKINRAYWSDIAESTAISGVSWIAGKVGKQYSYYFNKMM